MTQSTLLSLFFTFYISTSSDYYCLSTTKSYNLNGTYIAHSETTDGYLVSKLTHSCGDKYMFYNSHSAYSGIYISAYVHDPASNSISYYLECANNQQKDPEQCTGWYPRYTNDDIYVTNSACEQLCGDVGTCSPQHQIKVLFATAAECNGYFEKVDNMDNIYAKYGESGSEDEPEPTIYWWKKYNNWKCSTELKRCVQGEQLNKIEQIDDETMKQNVICDVTKDCNPTTTSSTTTKSPTASPILLKYN